MGHEEKQAAPAVRVLLDATAVRKRKCEATMQQRKGTGGAAAAREQKGAGCATRLRCRFFTPFPLLTMDASSIFRSRFSERQF
ncbi:unnamed protein product [Urochloa humidicola]